MTKQKKTQSATTPMQQAVLKRIESGEVRMKSRVYFVLLTALTILATVAAGLVISYLVSIVTFIIRIQTANTPALGARANLSEALANFPWWAVVLAVGLVAVALWLMRTHGRMYRHKTSIVLLVLVASSVILGVGMSYAGIGHPESGMGVNHSTEQSPHDPGNGARRGWMK